MAKFEKLDQKQMPQVIVLGVLCVGVLGYGVMQAVGGEKKPAPAAEQASATSEPAGATSTTPEAEAGVQITQTGAPGLQLPGTFNPDPFRPLKTGKPVATPPPAPAPAPAPAPTRTARLPKWPTFEGLPSLGGNEGLPPAQPSVITPAPPPGPVRPTVVLTGVIDVEDGDDMALAVLDGKDRRILQVGDVVANNYRVKKIAMDGILLINGTDKYFVTLGKKDEAAAAAPIDATLTPPQG